MQVDLIGRSVITYTSFQEYSLSRLRDGMVATVKLMRNGSIVLAAAVAATWLSVRGDNVGATFDFSDGVSIKRKALTCLETGRNERAIPWEGWTSVNYKNRQKIEFGKTLNGKEVLYIGGPASKCDTAWRAVSPRVTVPKGADRCFLSFNIESACPLPETDGKVVGWNNVFHWYGANGAAMPHSTMSYIVEKAGVTRIRTSVAVPDGAVAVSVQFGCDKPDVGAGERVVYSDIEVSFSDGTPAYLKEGRFVSSIRKGGRISWKADTPAGTAVRFRVRGGADGKALDSAPLVGPDGSPKTFYTGPFEANFPYVQYEAQLISAPGVTPALKEVRVGNTVDRNWLPVRDKIAPCVKVVSETPTTDRSERLKLKVTDGSCVDWRSVSVSVDGKNMTESFARNGDVLAQTGSAAWRDGLHSVNVVAADMHGNCYTNRLAFFIGEAPDVPKVTLRDDGMVLVGGKPFFPIGAYGVCKREFNGMDYDVAFEGLKAAGFNFAHTYDNTWDSEFLAAARKYGFKLWVAGRYMHRNFFEKGRNNPEILSWYIGDDTSINTRPEELLCYHNSLKAVDPMRITCQADVIFSNREISNFAPYVTGADVFMPEIYPVLGWEGDPRDEICVAVTIRDMQGVHREMRDFGDGKPRSVWPIMQWFKGWLGWQHFPSRQQLFATSFAALANDANGITWYTYGGFYDKKRKAHNEGMTSAPDRWRDMGDLATWIKELSPALLERTGSQPSVEVVRGPKSNKLGGPTITYLLKRHGGTAYLIAVNATMDNVKARFRIDGVGDIAEAMRENRKVKCAGGVLEDEFGPIGFHVYKLTDRPFNQ